MISATEICAILEACGKSRVLSFNYGALNVTFAPEGYVKPEVELAFRHTAEGWTPTQVKEAEKTMYAEQEQRLKQEELENLKLSDPEMYEELVLQDQLSQPRPEGHPEPTIA
jgi:restriction endonuclease Mrr